MAEIIAADQRFVREGKTLYFDNSVLVIHENCYGAGEFMSQRFAHGKEFGAERAASISSIRTLILLILSPLIPLIFLSKIVRQPGIARQLTYGFSAQAGWLLVFVVCWVAGEAMGYASKLFRPRR